MLKHILICAYMFSVLYCYLQINIMINRCIELFERQHPLIPLKRTSAWSEFKLYTEVLAVSAIPVINLIVAFIISQFDDSVISEVVSNVEMKHWKEIKDAESGVKNEN